MPFVLKLRDVIVGRSTLADRDAARRTARGPFRPGLGWELVEPIFDLRPADGAGATAEQRQRYRAARDTLALALHGADGALIDTSRIDIVRDAASPTGLTLEVALTDDARLTAPGPAGPNDP